MSQFPSLFDAPADPLPVRSTDPETSRAAAQALPLSNRRAEVLIALRHMIVSASACDIAAFLVAEGFDRQANEVASRLNELHKAGLVQRVGVKDGRRGKRVGTWVLTAAGRKAAA
jgi:hypothetical protein